MSDGNSACRLSGADGLGALTRIVTAQLPAAAVAAEMAGRSKKRSGKPKPSAARRARDGSLGNAVAHLVTQAVDDYAKKNELRLVPNMALLSRQDPEGEDGHYELTYAIEVQPQIDLPDLSECVIKVPEPVMEDGFYKKVIADLPSRFPDWEEVDRPARLNDRLTVAPIPPALRKKLGEERQTLGSDADPAVLELLLGKSAGDTIEPNEGSAGIPMTIVRVEKPIVPEYDLAFAEKLNPDCGSIEEFERIFRQRHEDHMQHQIKLAVAHRARRLLDEVVPQFPLPEAEIADSLMGWRMEVQRKMPHVSLVDEVGEEGLVAARAAIAESLRRSKLMEAFVVAEELTVGKEEVEAQASLLAADFVQPDLAKKRILADQEQLRKIAGSVMLYKASMRISELARKVPDPVSVEKLDRLASGEEDDDEPQAPDS